LPPEALVVYPIFETQCYPGIPPSLKKKNCENEIWQKQNKKRTIIVETEKKEKFAEKSHTELHMNTHTPMSIRRKQKTQKNC